MSRIKIGSSGEYDEDVLNTNDSIQFLDVKGKPRVVVNAEGNLEILFNTSGNLKLCVMPIVGNVVQIGLR